MRRAYHFAAANFALDDLRLRHLKIALLDDLNDPFELWAIAQPDPSLRRALRATKQKMAREHGLLCFSLGWQNPVMWSHYADKHRGVALGFDVAEQILKAVSYRSSRAVLREELGNEVAHDLLFTKFIDWQYEQEARIYVNLEEKDHETGLYFADFGEQLVLREVIAGPLCTVSDQALREAAGSATGVEFKKARLAFNTFSVVVDQRGFVGHR